MDSWAARVRADPAALIGAPASALGEVLNEVTASWERDPPRPFSEIPADRPIVAIGDSHGDWPAVSSAFAFARRPGVDARFVGLGDYLHRATRSSPDPAELPGGSVWNVAFLLAWMAHDPDHVVLLRGNHEATRQIPVLLPTLLRELRRIYGRSEALSLWKRVLDLLDRLPLAARTANGVFFAHGGIPPRDLWDPRRWDPTDLRLLEGLLWSDPELEYEDRSVGSPYNGTELREFLGSVGCHVMVKGHAPNHSGRAIYDGQLLTVHTSDLFAAWGEGGVLLAEVPARTTVRSAHDVRLRAWDGVDWLERPIRFVPNPGPPGADPTVRPASSETTVARGK